MKPDIWMDGWMDVWMDGWMDGWMDEWMDIISFDIKLYVQHGYLARKEK